MAFKVGDRVAATMFRGATYTGTIIEVDCNNYLAYVEFDKPHNSMLDCCHFTKSQLAKLTVVDEIGALGRTETRGHGSGDVQDR